MKHTDTRKKDSETALHKMLQQRPAEGRASNRWIVTTTRTLRRKGFVLALEFHRQLLSPETPACQQLGDYFLSCSHFWIPKFTFCLIRNKNSQKAEVMTRPQRLKINDSLFTPGGSTVMYYLIRRFFQFSAIYLCTILVVRKISLHLCQSQSL